MKPSARLRLVLADDHPAFLEGLRKILELDYDVLAAVTDGESALAEAARLSPDVVVCDISMPDLNGFELAARLREGGGALILVALTGFGSDEDRRRTAEAGFDAHFVKPVDPNALAAVKARSSEKA